MAFHFVCPAHRRLREEVNAGRFRKDLLSHQLPCATPTSPAIVEASLFLRMRAVTRLTGPGRSTTYRFIAQDKSRRL